MQVAARASIVHTGRRRALEAQRGRLRAGEHGQVAPLARGAQVGIGARTPRTVALGDLVQPHAELLVAIEVRIVGVAGFLCGGDEGSREGIVVAQVGDRQRAGIAVQRTGATTVALAVQEPRQHLLPAPAGGAAGCPAVVVVSHAAHVAHRIDRTRSPQHLAAWPPQAPAAERGLRLGLQVPVDAAVVDQPRQPGRHVDEGVGIARAGFQQQHPAGRVFAEPVGQHAAGRAGPNHDVVVHAAPCRGARRA